MSPAPPQEVRDGWIRTRSGAHAVMFPLTNLILAEQAGQKCGLLLSTADFDPRGGKLPLMEADIPFSQLEKMPGYLAVANGNSTMSVISRAQIAMIQGIGTKSIVLIGRNFPYTVNEPAGELWEKYHASKPNGYVTQHLT